jgi:hypothetical protein
MPDFLLPCGTLLAAALIGFGLCTLYIQRRVVEPLTYRLYRLEQRVQRLSAPQLVQPSYRYRTVETDAEDYEFS